MVARVLGVKDVLVDDEGRAPGLRSVSTGGKKLLHFYATTVCSSSMRMIHPENPENSLVVNTKQSLILQRKFI